VAMIVHAQLDDGTVCGRIDDSEEITSHWPDVTCGDCQLASERNREEVESMREDVCPTCGVSCLRPGGCECDDC
jgi:hypothetical protein